MNYDGLRRLSGVTAGIVSKNYTYRDISDTQTTTQVTQLNYPNIGTGMGFGYTYDVSGNIATYTAPDGEVITYTYDSQGQLLSAVGDSTYSYTYDAAGNILTANGHTYTYGDSDWKDLLTAFDNGEITYDASGNPTSYYNGTRWTMTWENGRQLISASTTSDTEDVTVTYVYDMNGLRVSKTVTVNTYVIHTHNYERIVEDPTCTTKGYIHYICDCGAKLGTTVVQPLGHDYVQTGTTTYVCTRCGDSTGNDLIVTPDPGGDDRFLRPTDEDVEDSLSVAAGTTSFTTSRILVSTEVKQHDYIYASGKLLREVITTGEGDTATTQILDFFYDSNGTPLALKTNDIVYYYVTNLQGDVIQLVDSTGTAVAAYEYDPYGNIVSQTGDLADLNPLRYRGYYYDAETGFYYLQSRYYDPKIGRFINADSYASTGHGILGYNMFAYCLNNPVVFIDSTGTYTTVRRLFEYNCIEALAGCGAGIASLTISITITEKLVSSLTTAIAYGIEKQKEEIQNKLVVSLEKVTTPKQYKTEYEMHHISAKKAPNAAEASVILEELLPGGIDDPLNLVAVKTSVHRRLHTNLYYTLANQLIISAYNEAAGNPEKQFENVVGSLLGLRLFIESLNQFSIN